MGTYSIQTELINILKKNTPEGQNTVDLLRKITFMSKEAAYRRLRGEISFSAKEAICICQKFNFSLDQLMQIKRKDTFTFHLSPIFMPNLWNEYFQMMSEIMKVMEIMRSNPESFGYNAQTTLPLEFAFRYKQISRFAFFKWIYQLNPTPDLVKFSDINLPQKVCDIQKAYTDVALQINLSMVLDAYSFVNFVKDVKFFTAIDLVSEEGVLEIKNEALLMLDEMESVANKRYLQNEPKLQMYVSRTFFDASYMYIESGDYKSCALRIYGFNNLSCENQDVCDDLKAWIDSLIRYSILISGSGELYRLEYFKKQREIINTL